MLSTVLSRVLVCTSLALADTAVLAKETQAFLSCETAKVEQASLRQAPGGARRVEKHVLEVTTKKGPRRFVDKPPYEENDMGGLHWRYCGFNAQVRAHLIERLDESSYSGNILLNESGRLLPAGHTVLFAPGANAFLAIEQQDGVDGENWAVYDPNGNVMWKGYAGTIAKVDGIDTVVSTFDHPQWTKQGELSARFVCASSKARGTVRFAQTPAGDWGWRGQGKCP